MPFTMVQEDSSYKCTQCGHVMKLKKGKLLPPCTRCRALMEKYEGPLAGPEPTGCG